MNPEAVITVLLLLFPRMSHGNRECIVQRREAIVSQLREAEETFGIPPAIMASVAFVETHLGCDRNEGGNWGAPVSPTRRHSPGTHLHAARALATSWRVCGGGTWEPAVLRFHVGLCRPGRRRSAYANTVLTLTHRLWDFGFSRRWQDD